jgi:signal transduction histidine kinase
MAAITSESPPDHTQGSEPATPRVGLDLRGRSSTPRVEASAPPLRRRQEDRDILGRFQRPLVWFRWLVLVLSALTTALSGRISENRTALLALVIWTAIRTLEPVRQTRTRFRTMLPLLLELGVACLIVSGTGGWASPNTLVLIPPLLVIACVGGTTAAMSISFATGVLITTVMADSGDVRRVDLEDGIRWTGIFLLVALLVGTGFRYISEAAKVQQLSSARMQQLQEANALLYDLQRIARRLPSSLDLADVLRTTTAEFSSTVGLSRVCILLCDEHQHTWTVVEALGTSMPMSIEGFDLPPSARTAINARTVVIGYPGEPSMLHGGNPSNIRVGAYVPLVSRERLIGLLVAETLAEESWNASEVETTRLEEVSRQFAGPAAIAIDNARGFSSIRSTAADDERVRIARDLHDRIGQHLALLGFEVDRITRACESETLKAELVGLRSQVRDAVKEVRETLYDLRTEVTQDEGIAVVLENFLGRVEERSGIVTVLDVNDSHQLPLRVAREMWHIAQEAIVNAERHAQCSTIKVRWATSSTMVELDVIDDGQGFTTGAGRSDSYGLRGLRERAAAIGAHVDVRSQPDSGTAIRVRFSDV